MYHVVLDDAARCELRRRVHDPKTKPRTRDRIEIVRLSAAGWRAKDIAQHMGVCIGTVRTWLKAFLRHGFDALADKPHPGPPSALSPQILEAIRQYVRQEGEAGRTCTAQQVADWLAAEHGLRLTAAWVSRKLHAARLSYKRTSRHLKHKQKPEEVALKKAEKEDLEKRPRNKGDAGELDVAVSDEFGVSMTLPTSYGWYPVGERLRVPFEASQGRRVNGIGLVVTHGPEAGRFEVDLRAKLPKDQSKKATKSLEARAREHGVRPEEVGTIDAGLALAFLWSAAGRPVNAPADWKRERPLFVYLDNYSVHTSKQFKAARPALEAANIFVVYLPAYSPELSDIEPIWNDVKYHRMTQRSFQVLGHLMSALRQALHEKSLDLLASHKTHELCAQVT